MKTRQPFRWDLVVKIGGSLGQGRSLPAILRRIARLARRRHLLAIPGGGRFADLVRVERGRLALDEASAHRIALLAMDQYGLLLSALCPEARPVTDLETARRVAARGLLPVLLASSIIDRERRLERSFRLTSDSIAAFVAGKEKVPRLVLLKSCAGLAGPVAGWQELRDLARRGVVDPLFPWLVRRGSEIWVVNGRSAVAWDRILAKQERGVSRRAGRPGRRPAGPDRSAPVALRRRAPHARQ